MLYRNGVDYIQATCRRAEFYILLYTFGCITEAIQYRSLDREGWLSWTQVPNCWYYFGRLLLGYDVKIYTTESGLKVVRLVNFALSKLTPYSSLKLIKLLI